MNACTVTAWFRQMYIIRLSVGTLNHQTPLQMNNIYSLHVSTVFLLHVLVLHQHQGQFYVLYFKPHSVMQLIGGGADKSVLHTVYISSSTKHCIYQ
jgi:hypothetical protein